MKALQLLNDLFTARNGVDYSLTKLLGISAGIAMIYQFVATESGDYSGFGTGIGLIMAALAAKYMAEK
jgi:hypothetical protein